MNIYLRISMLFLATAILLLFSSCNKNNNLAAEGYTFYRLDEFGNQHEVSDAIFYPGETILIYLINVGPLKANADLQYKINLDVKVLNNKKKTVFEKNEYLGEDGFIYHEEYLPYAYAVWQTKPDTEPGSYTFQVRVNDMESGFKTIFKPEFELMDN